MKFKLRKFRKGDEKSLQKNINDREIYRTTANIIYPYKLKHARFWVKHNLKLNKVKKPDELNFVIDIGGEVVGSIGFNKIDYKNKKGEIGYWLAKKYWGNGIMTQAVRQLVKTGFSDLKLNRICACVFTNNPASSKVLKKSGFELEGKLRKCLIKDNKPRDSFLYAKVK